ncbi:MAG TPA: DNA methyltransferase [Gemmataceae bacterium]
MRRQLRGRKFGTRERETGTADRSTALTQRAAMPRRNKPAQESRDLFHGISRPLSTLSTQTIYCGDNLEQLPRLPDESVDLIYVDPPFNSNRVYETFWGETKEKRAFEDRHESTRAYIDYMMPRCKELARVLKKTGSFYFHCDWHASHYVKVMLDRLFGENNFQNEIIWKRSTAHSDSKQGSKHYGRIHDVLLFYTGNPDDYTWNQLYTPLDPEYIKSHYSQIDEDGQRFQWTDLTGPGGAAKGNPFYEVLGVKGYWRYKQERMEQLIREGRVAIPPRGKVPRYKRFLHESKGLPLQSVWDDLPPVNSQAKESIGYPTQKPLALLERIIQASSDPDDIILDAFCGCGTALVAAEKLDRRWIGIDSSPTACRVMAQRLVDVCKLQEGKNFFVRDMPRGIDELRRMPHFEFQNWAVNALGGIPNKTKTGDKGIDGRIYPIAAVSKKNVNKPGDFDFMNDWYPVQVKQQDKAGREDIDAFEAAMQREGRAKGFFVSFDFTSGAYREIDGFFKRTGCVIVPLTVREILDEEIAMKLA